MSKGGARKGAGRKPKPLAEKLAAGNPGKRPLKKVEFVNNTYDPSTPPAYLKALEKKSGNTVVTPTEIYQRVIAYLEPSDCLHLIPEELICEYVMANYYSVQAKYELSQSNHVGINNKGEVVVTSFAVFMQKQQKQVLDIWDKIWEIVSRNSERIMDNPEHDMLALILSGRVRKKRGADDYATNGDS